jgi:hypothetical protein
VYCKDAPGCSGFARGVFVACSTCNKISGPGKANGAPWITTIGRDRAPSIDLELAAYFVLNSLTNFTGVPL